MDNNHEWDSLREKIIGLGDSSVRKSYYPQLQERLVELERFRALLDASNDAIFLFNTGTGKFVDVNQSACSLTGLTREELLSLERESWTESPSAVHIKEMFYFADEIPSNIYRVSVKNPAQGNIILEINHRQVGFESENFVVFVARDVTERTRREKERETLGIISNLFLNFYSLEEIYAQIPRTLGSHLDIPRIAIGIHNPLLGRVEIVGSRGFDEEQDLPLLEKIAHKVMEEKKEIILSPSPVLKTLICVPLKVIHSVQGMLILGDFREPAELEWMLETLRGVARHLALEIRRKGIEQEILEKNRELNDFAHRVCQNLKGPINILKGFLTKIYEEPHLLEEYFPRVMRQSEKMADFVSRLWELSRAGKLIGEKIPIDLERMIKSIFTETKEGIRAELVLESPLLPLYGDLFALEQVFRYLFSNCVHYRDPKKEQIIITVSTKKSSDYVIISIRDNGMGIKKEHINHIFDVGWTSSYQESRGFGLSIVKRIISAHQGKIWAESQGENTGSTFFIALPV